MRHITGQPIKFVGVGEKIENLEEFYPDRISNRILGMGDIVQQYFPDVSGFLIVFLLAP